MLFPSFVVLADPAAIPHPTCEILPTFSDILHGSHHPVVPRGRAFLLLSQSPFLLWWSLAHVDEVLFYEKTHEDNNSIKTFELKPWVGVPSEAEVNIELCFISKRGLFSTTWTSTC